MIVPKELQQIKQKAEDRYNLVLEKNKIHKEMKKVISNLDSHIYQTSVYTTQKDRDKDLSFVSYLDSCLDKIRAIENQILDIDRELILAYETTLGSFVAKVTLPERVNEAGDTVSKNTFFFVPNETDNDYNEVTLDDLYTLRALKGIFNPSEIDFIPKEEYKRRG